MDISAQNVRLRRVAGDDRPVSEAMIRLKLEANRCDERARRLIARFGRFRMSKRRRAEFRRMRRRARYCRRVANSHADWLFSPRRRAA